MNYILSMDQGTTSSRAIIFDKKGRIVSVAQKEFKQIFPKPGWVEHNPDEIFSTQVDVTKTAITNNDAMKGIELSNDNYISETLVTHKSTNFKEVIKSINTINE